MRPPISLPLLKLMSSMILILWPCFVARAEVAVSLPPLAGLVHLLDSQVDTFCLLPSNADPHHFSMTPRLLERLRHSDTLIRTSRDDQGWPGLNTGMRQIDLWPNHDHAWLNPGKVLDVLPGLAREIQALYPDRKISVADSLTRFRELIKVLDAEVSEKLTSVRKTGVILQHASWKSFCEYYNIPILAIAESNKLEGALGPKQLEKLLNILHQHPKAYLWGDQGHSNLTLEWLSARMNGKHIILLDPLGSCSDPWDQLLRNNISRMTER
ncbi:MAG: metal ABC transporter substrate-binding protein [Mariprofundaceae bacterium]